MVCAVRLLVAAHIVLLLATYSLALPPRTLRATVERVADGDTLVATSENGTRLRIRLFGIDAPEVPHGNTAGQPFGIEARHYLARLVINHPVEVELFGSDAYKRRLAVLWVEGANINVAMVRAGLAEMYRGRRCEAYCRALREAEAEAQREHAGMWALARYESPARYRKRVRNAPHG
jgi:endonuclease YncB( thermonuclease family)